MLQVIGMTPTGGKNSPVVAEGGTVGAAVVAGPGAGAMLRGAPPIGAPPAAGAGAIPAVGGNAGAGASTLNDGGCDAVVVVAGRIDGAGAGARKASVVEVVVALHGAAGSAQHSTDSKQNGSSSLQAVSVMETRAWSFCVHIMKPRYL